MLRKLPFLLVLILFASSLILAGCDTSAERELKRAEKALDEALAFNADAYATDDYNAAEALMNEAAELSADNRIQEARQAAIKAKLKAEDAKRKAEERHKILSDEMDQLGR